MPASAPTSLHRQLIPPQETTPAKLTWAVATAALLLASASAHALPPDGRNIPTDFAGHLVAAQRIGTAFGDDTNPSQTAGGGSELDAIFVHSDVSSGRFRMGITGNLEDVNNNINGNGIVVYLDTRPGGENILDANGGFSGFGGRYVPAMEGSRFDAGFLPDFAIIINSAGAGFGEFFVDTVDLTANVQSFRGQGVLGSGSGLLVGGSNPSAWSVAFDNGNVLGVGGSTAGAPDPNALTATSGIEFDLAAIDFGLQPGWTLGVQVNLTGGNLPSFVSNQNLPSLPDFTPNLAFGPIDYTTIAGQQFANVALVPAPGITASIVIATCVIARRRR